MSDVVRRGNTKSTREERQAAQHVKWWPTTKAYAALGQPAPADTYPPLKQEGER